MALINASDVGILVVDDEDFVRDVAARVLKELGYRRLQEAADGHEALAKIRTAGTQIDVIVCDLKMPDMDGVELVRHLAEQPTSPAIIFLSGGQSSLLRAAENLARTYGLDVLGSLSKPLSRAGLVKALDALQGREAPSAPRAKLDIGQDEIREAIQAAEFWLHYQPKVGLKSNKLESVEALVRWRHPKHGLLGPVSFVGLAEAGPLIGPFTEHLVELGFKQLAAWHKTGFKVPMALNLSPATLTDVSLPDRLATLAKSLGLEPREIIFEITETGLAKHEAVYFEIVTRLHMKGFRLSIDDFGTGQSSLQKLESLPFSELKIDRQFVHGAHRNEAKRAILEASLGLARSFQLKTVAEGVEEADDLALLKKLGCDVAQGFIYSKALPEADLVEWALAGPKAS